MSELFLYRNREDKKERDSSSPVVVTGEVIFESVHHHLHKKALKEFVHQAMLKRAEELKEEVVWASYLVIFSPGQEYEEVRCQIDIDTNGEKSGFSIGYGSRPNHAFNDAMERLRWFEKNNPNKMVV